MHPTQHPEYARWRAEWIKLGDIFEGTGGFADGGYIVPHISEWLDYSSATPTKPSPELTECREIARYENFGRRLVDQAREPV